MSYIFVPKDFNAPYEVETKKFTLRKLTVEEVEKDYKAVMSSKESLRQIFDDNDDWPADDMTLEKNYEDLQYHQEEFDTNKSFAYTIVTPDNTKCIGCLYIYPFKYGVYDSQVYYWFIDEVNGDLSSPFQIFIKDWIPEVFKLKNIVYPGRSISHGEFKNLAKQLKDKSEN